MKWIASSSLLGFLVMFSGIALLPATAESSEWLRDTGFFQLAASAVGSSLALFAVIRSFRRELPDTGRVPGGKVRLAVVFLAALTLAGSVFQWLYVLRITYQMPPAERVVAAGAELPAVVLRGADGGEVDLRAFNETGLLVSFYRGHW